MIRDINSAWERLEKAEHERELALREELIRQEKLEQLAARYSTYLIPCCDVDPHSLRIRIQRLISVWFRILHP